MPPLEDADMNGRGEDLEAVLRKGAEDFSSPCPYTPDVMASCNMLANVHMLTSAAHKSLTIVTFDSLTSHHAPLGTKRLHRSKETFPVYEQIK